jgi:hypothetical protein
MKHHKNTYKGIFTRTASAVQEAGYVTPTSRQGHKAYISWDSPAAAWSTPNPKHWFEHNDAKA